MGLIFLLKTRSLGSFFSHLKCFFFYLNPESVIELVVCVVEQVTLDSVWILHFFPILPFKICFQHVKGEGLKRSSCVFPHLREKRLHV